MLDANIFLSPVTNRNPCRRIQYPYFTGEEKGTEG
jgi:hypothetical protein